MIEIQNEDGRREVGAGQFPNPRRPVPEEDDLLRLADAPPPGFVAQQGGEAGHRLERAHVAGGLVVPQRLARRVGGGLGEDAPQFDLAGLGGAVGLLAFPTDQFPGQHGNAGAIGFHVADGHGFGRHRGAGELELGGDLRPAVGHQPLDLAAVNVAAGQFLQIVAGSFEAFAGGGPAGQSDQPRRGAVDQAQGFVQRTAPLVRRRRVEVVPVQVDRAEDRVHRARAGGMTFFPRLALGRGQILGRRLHQLLQRGAAILEQRGAQPQLDGFQIADAQLLPLPLDQGYEGLGFRAAFGLALGRRQAFFFFTPSGADSAWVI